MKQLRSVGLIAAFGLLSTCAAAPSRVEATGEKRWFPLTVAFGADENTLLMGTCPTGAEDRRDCRVEVLDLKTNRSVAFTAPPGRFLQMPSLAADGRSILAVATAIPFDDTGNRPATVIRFDPDAPERAEVVLDSETELLMPSETKWGFAAWSEKCKTATQKYCAKSPVVRLAGAAAAQGLGHSYEFNSVGPILVREEGIVAEAEYPPSSDLNAPSAYDLEHRNALWRLSAQSTNGSERIAQGGLAVSLLAVSGAGRLYVIAEDRDGIGIFIQNGRPFQLAANYPAIAKDGSIVSLAAVDGRRLAGVILYPRHLADETSLILADNRYKWTSLKLTRPQTIQEVRLVPKKG